MIYVVNIYDIELALMTIGGEAKSAQIQNEILQNQCSGVIPENYQSERSFRQTIQRKIEDYCPQAEGFDPVKRAPKFLRVGHGFYRLISSSNANYVPAIEEVTETEGLHEGAFKQINVNVYERNRLARTLCINHHGLSCVVCDFNFQKTYGDIGKGFIEVHHIKPLSEINSVYKVDPINDLRPVCANCHAIIHRVKPPLTIDEIKKQLLNID